MFRRRPLGRRPRRPINRTRFQLRQAHQMMEAGQYLQAAPIFEQLALGALRLQVPRAPFLFVEAGRAFFLGGAKDKGLGLLRRGLDLLAEAGRWAELARVGERVADELAEQGAEQDSAKLRAWLESVVPANGANQGQEQISDKGSRPVLPTHCPQCGGRVDPNTVTWLDGVTVECLYCGSAIRAEN